MKIYIIIRGGIDTFSKRNEQVVINMRPLLPLLLTRYASFFLDSLETPQCNFAESFRVWCYYFKVFVQVYFYDASMKLLTDEK